MDGYPIRNMLELRKKGIHCGIPSFCSANKLVIECVLEEARANGDYAVIEATSNQVNQCRGYMDMNAYDFRRYVFGIADRMDFDRSRIILGGDHIGPLPWADLPPDAAMRNAEELVEQSVLAGFRKIHLDTSMLLGGETEISDEMIAERGARLYRAAERAFNELHSSDPEAVHPVFVIGSEVPVSGGAPDEDMAGRVTSPEDFERTLAAYKKKFRESGMDDAWEHIIAVVIQPGVEFCRKSVCRYDRVRAEELTRSLRRHPDIVFEGHSTDYQSPDELREMVEDGIAIIKVGPALTYAMREALFSLAMIERELIPEDRRSRLIEVLEEAMDEEPGEWNRWYDGNPRDIKLQKKYSFFDRSRYYLSKPHVQEAVRALFRNLDEEGIPLMMIHQYMPLQYMAVRDGRVTSSARELVKENVRIIVREYFRVTRGAFFTDDIEEQ